MLFVLFYRVLSGVLFAFALSSLGVVACAQDSTSDVSDLRHFDALNERGWAIQFPSIADTILGDTGGIRSTLADAGIGFIGFSSPNVFEYDLTQSNAGKPLAVNGQVGTWNAAYQGVFVTFDTGKIGLDSGQLVFSLDCALNDLPQVNGPDSCRIRDIAYNQIFANKTISIQVGEYANDVRFVGAQVGGAIATGSLGPQAFIPYEVGLSYAGFGTPAAEIKINIPGDFYDRAGVQRSLPPGGGNVEARINPGVGLKFAPVGTSALFINEFGYEKAASVSQEFTWIRIGGIYNTTHFRNFANGHNTDNWAIYALWDRQLTTLSERQPYRGLYIGASAMYAPPQQNLFSQYYEARIYDMGPFDARPGDFASLVISHETYSREGQEVFAPPAFGSNDATTSVIGSYAFHVRPGIYVQPGLGLTTNPSVSHLYNNSFDVYLSLTAYL